MDDRRRHERVSLVMAAGWLAFMVIVLTIGLGLALWLWSGG